MLTIGDKFPTFSMKAATRNDHAPDDFATITTDTYKGKWLCVFFWPKDFTFVCPTEIAAFGKMSGDFKDRDCQILGGSTDNEFVHMAWRNSHNDLKDLPFPMVAAQKLSAELGILDKSEGRLPARDLSGRPRRHHPFRVGERSFGRAQPRRGAARSRRVADRRALPLQLAEGRGYAASRLILTSPSWERFNLKGSPCPSML